MHLCESPGGTCGCPWHLGLKTKQHNTSMACAKRRLRGHLSPQMSYMMEAPPTLAAARAAAKAAAARAAAEAAAETAAAAREERAAARAAAALEQLEAAAEKQQAGGLLLPGLASQSLQSGAEPGVLQQLWRRQQQPCMHQQLCMMGQQFWRSMRGKSRRQGQPVQQGVQQLLPSSAGRPKGDA